MTIYIATSGEYSDYRINEVFTDKEQALIYCATNGCELEEYEADKVKLTADKPVVEEWHGAFDLMGNYTGADMEGYCFERPARVCFNSFSQRFFLTLYLPLNTTEELVKKVMCDAFAEWKYLMLEEGKLPWLK